MSVATVGASDVHRVPSGVSLEAAALVQLGVICRQGIRRAEIVVGEQLVVVGAGLIGVLTARLAIAEGAGPVTIVARSRFREKIARAAGVSRFLVSGDEDEIGALASPVVIEATGDPSGLQTAIAAAGTAARVVLLGSTRGVTTGIPVDAIRAKALRLVGAHALTLTLDARQRGEDLEGREARRFLDDLAAGRLHVDDLLADTVDPREAPAFYRRLATSRDLVGARFDWTRLPKQERVAPRRLLSPPRLSARGIDMGIRPLPARAESRTRGVAYVRPKGAKALGIGLLGCGDIAMQNAGAIGSAQGVTLVACFDPVEQLAREIADVFGVTACPSSDALLARPDVDAVLLAVPHDLHAPIGGEAARAGKHVIVEKPLANDLESAQTLVETAERAGVALSVCFPQRYEPAVVEARRALDDGALGEVTGLVLRFLADKPPSYWTGGFSGRAQTDWRRSRARSGGGVLIMNLTHSLDLVRHLTGLEADSVTAQTQVDEAGSEIEDGVAMTVRFDNGALGSIHGATSVRGSGSSEFRLWGRDGQIAIEPNPLVYTVRALPGMRAGRWHSLVASGRQVNSRAVYFERLADAIRSGCEPEVTGQDGLAVQAYVEAAYRSAETGEAVRPRSLLGSATGG
jgi:predicted dehydrogenase